MDSKRPVFLDFTRLALPANAIVSIAHRFSGILLFLAVPVGIYVLDLSLQSAAGFEQAKAILNHGLTRFFAAFLLWAAAHHLLAGIRFLLLDIGLGIERADAIFSAKVVNYLGLLVFVIIVVVLL